MDYIIWDIISGLFFSLIVPIVVIVVILRLVLRSGNKSNQQPSAGSYDQGYWDGYRAFGKKVSAILDREKIDREELERAVRVGFTGDDSVDTALISLSDDEQAWSPSPVRPVSPADKEKTNLRNANVLLYMASFLLVAAGAALVGTAMDNTAKLISVALLTIIFYLVGIELYRRVPRLKPAAVAFTGTGLALLPFFGSALNTYGGLNASDAWFATSVLGVVMYFAAAIILKSQVVSYLTMAFVLSLASSSAATVSAPLIWHFVVIIAISLLASLISFVKPSWMPTVFREPIERTGQVVTPLALGASIVLFSQLSVRDYEIIFATATAHYMVAWLQVRSRDYQNAARMMVHLTALAVAWDISRQDPTMFGIIFLEIAVAQLLVSLGFQVWHRTTHMRNESIWAVVSIGLQCTAMLFWLGDVNAASYHSLALIFIAGSGTLAYICFRKIGFAWVTLVVSFILPVLVGRSVIVPEAPWEVLGIVYAAMAVPVLYTYRLIASRHSAPVAQLLQVAFIGYIVELFVISLLMSDHVLAILVLATGGFLAIVASWLYRTAGILVLGVIVGTFAIGHVWWLIDGELAMQQWAPIQTAWTAAVLTYIGSWVLALMNDTRRQRVLLRLVVSILGIAAAYGTVASGDLATAAAWSVVMIGLVVGGHGVYRKNQDKVELGAYVLTLGLQYLILRGYPDVSWLLYAHWWAATTVAMAVYRKDYAGRLKIAMAWITGVGGVYALSYSGGYSLLFLAEHIVLLMIGAFLSRSWAIWWGIIASSLAVLYFLRDIAFAAFGFLGLLLIGFGIWRLTKAAHKEEPPVDNQSTKQ